MTSPSLQLLPSIGWQGTYTPFLLVDASRVTLPQSCGGQHFPGRGTLVGDKAEGVG